eukprot:CAMPEP_0170625334 /NCGR_PEP_ID=MMETSP0224-20130122/30702_1 /TAXON_ID=285029 /ORGANISM="Togula jolla, Strain CCCM 725" /LENGTH=315 /DNA_ID=CAMNT_0010951899 /DNA_START=40 /DNA_END=983 /DNA_ORIENTATION=+
MVFQEKRLQPLANPFLHYSEPRGTAAKRVHSYAGYVPYDLAERISSPLRSFSSFNPDRPSIPAAEARHCGDLLHNSDSPVEHLLMFLQAMHPSPQTCNEIAVAENARHQRNVEPIVGSGTTTATASTEASSLTNSAESTPRCHRRCHGSATAGLRHYDSGGGLSPGFAGASEKTTTVMMRNLPSTLCLKALMKEINSSGFKGRYDFCYIPSNFSTGRSKGFAFVNFLTAEGANQFFREWHGSKRFVHEDCALPLNLSAATIQGLEENLAKWNTAAHTPNQERSASSLCDFVQRAMLMLFFQEHPPGHRNHETKKC